MIIRYTIVLLATILPIVAANGRGEACSSDSDCDGQLSCVGNARNLKCFMKMGAGMECGKEPFWVCQEGLVCEDQICKTPVAGECNTPGSVCSGDMSCLGAEGNRKCFMPKGPGMRCGRDPFWVCRADLVCQDRICKTPEGGPCTPGSICAEGLSCVGTDEVKKCFMPKGLGMECGTDPFWACADGLTCMDGRCMKAVGRGKRCGAKRYCKSRFVCAGPSKNRRCILPGMPGRTCGLFDTCRDSTCIEGRCVV